MLLEEERAKLIGEEEHIRGISDEMASNLQSLCSDEAYLKEVLARSEADL